MITIQRVSPRFAHENREIGAADMTGSRYVREPTFTPVQIESFALALQQFGEGISKAMASVSKSLTDAGLTPEQPPTDPRARALWAKQHQNHGPAQDNLARRGRVTKYKEKA